MLTTAHRNPSSQLSAEDHSLLIGAIVTLHKKKSLSARDNAKIVESEEFGEAHCYKDPEGSKLRREADLVMEGCRNPSSISAAVSSKAKSSSSHASTPDISGLSEPQKVSDNPIFQVKKTYEKIKAELNEYNKERLESQSVEIGNKPEAKKESIQFKDAVGRNFEFPFQFCNTWLVGSLTSDSSSSRAESWFSSTRVWKI